MSWVDFVVEIGRNPFKVQIIICVTLICFVFLTCFIKQAEEKKKSHVDLQTSLIYPIIEHQYIQKHLLTILLNELVESSNQLKAL